MILVFGSLKETFQTRDQQFENISLRAQFQLVKEMGKGTKKALIYFLFTTDANLFSGALDPYIKIA